MLIWLRRFMTLSHLVMRCCRISPSIRNEKELTVEVSIPVVCGSRWQFSSKAYSLAQEAKALNDAAREAMMALEAHGLVGDLLNSATSLAEQRTWPV